MKKSTTLKHELSQFSRPSAFNLFRAILKLFLDYDSLSVIISINVFVLGGEHQRVQEPCVKGPQAAEPEPPGAAGGVNRPLLGELLLAANGVHVHDSERARTELPSVPSAAALPHFTQSHLRSLYRVAL